MYWLIYVITKVGCVLWHLITVWIHLWARCPKQSPLQNSSCTLQEKFIFRYQRLSNIHCPRRGTLINKFTLIGETSNKKTKKHKRKKTSREKKHPEKLVGGADEQVDTLVMEDEDQEIFVDDIEMDEEDSTTPSDAASGAKLQISIPESPSEKK